MSKIHYLIYAVLVILNLILIITVRSYSKRQNVIEKEIETDCLISSIFSVNDAFANYKHKIIDYNEKPFLLSDIIKSDNKLVLYFTEDICESCLLSLLDIVNQKEFASISDNLILIASFNRYNSFKLFISNYKFNFKVYCIENNKIEISKKDTSNPCFFILDENLRINHLFVHDKNNELLTKLYLENVNLYYNSQRKISQDSHHE